MKVKADISRYSSFIVRIPGELEPSIEYLEYRYAKARFDAAEAAILSGREVIGMGHEQILARKDKP